MDRQPSRKISKETADLNNTMDERDHMSWTGWHWLLVVGGLQEHAAEWQSLWNSCGKVPQDHLWGEDIPWGGRTACLNPEKGLDGGRWFLSTDSCKSGGLLISRVDPKWKRAFPLHVVLNEFHQEKCKGWNDARAGLYQLTWSQRFIWLPFTESKVLVKRLFSWVEKTPCPF